MLFYDSLSGTFFRCDSNLATDIQILRTFLLNGIITSEEYLERYRNLSKKYS